MESSKIKVYQSYTGTYDICPKQCKMLLDKTKRMVQKDTGREFGTTVHEAIERYFKSLHKTSFDEGLIMNRTENMYKNNMHLFSGRDVTNFRKTISNFKKFELMRFHKMGKEMYVPDLVEKKYTCEYTTLSGVEVILGCIVDFYSEKAGLFIDWKTGKGIYVNEDQAGISKIVLEQNGFSPEIFSFIFLRSGKTITMKSDELTKTHKNIDSYVNSIIHKLFPKKESVLCLYCDFEIVCNMGEKMSARNWLKIGDIV